MNLSDSERIAGFLELHKFKPAKNINEASLVIFNTCGVRQSAEDRVYGQIHNLKTRNLPACQQGRKPVTIILTGCLANRKDVRRRLKDKVDIFVPINKFFSINLSSDMDCDHNLYQTLDYFNIKPKYSTPYSAYIPIMTGCNNFCSYCVVPYARGREVSRTASEIITEVRNLVKKGYKEIILLGQNVNSYKSVISNSQLATRKKNPNYKLPITNYVNFAQLLRKINSIPGNFWIRFLTSHPKDMSDELIETIAQCEKICEYIHLPVQSGSDEILKKMNRHYTVKHYLGLIKKIKSAFAKIRGKFVTIGVTTDIIVGFPGETRKQFLDSAEVMKKVGYDMVFFGQYSPRPGTVSWKMKDNVSKTEKVRREKYLNEILKKTALENNKKYIGTIQEILANRCTVNHSRELFTRQGRGIFQYFGRTRTMKNVKIHLTPALSLKRRGGKHEVDNLIGKFAKVKITKANIWNLEARLNSQKR